MATRSQRKTTTEGRSLDSIVSDHTSELSTLRELVSSVASGLGEVKDDLKTVVSSVNGLASHVNALKASEGTVNTKTALSSVMAAVAIMGFAWGVGSWMQARHDDQMAEKESHYESLLMEQRQTIRKQDKERIDNLFSELREHEKTDGHTQALIMHKEEETRLNDLKEAIEKLEKSYVDRLNEMDRRLQNEMDLKIKAMVDDRFTGSDGERLEDKIDRVERDVITKENRR